MEEQLNGEYCLVKSLVRQNEGAIITQVHTPLGFFCHLELSQMISISKLYIPINPIRVNQSITRAHFVGSLKLKIAHITYLLKMLSYL